MENEVVKKMSFIPTVLRKRTAEGFVPDLLPFKKIRKSSIISDVPVNDNKVQDSTLQTFTTPPRSRESKQFASPFSTLSPSVFGSPSPFGSDTSLTPRRRRIFKTKV